MLSSGGYQAFDCHYVNFEHLMGYIPAYISFLIINADSRAFSLWFLSEGMNTLIGYDLVPEAKILDSALRACRRLNDMASAIRILEAVKVSGCPFIRTAIDLFNELFFSVWKCNFW